MDIPVGAMDPFTLLVWLCILVPKQNSSGMVIYFRILRKITATYAVALDESLTNQCYDSSWSLGQKINTFQFKDVINVTSG